MRRSWNVVRRRYEEPIVALLSFFGITASTILLRAVGYHIAIAFAFSALFGAFFGLLGIVKPLVIAEMFGRASFGVISGAIALPTLVAFALGPSVGAVIWERGGYVAATAIGTASAAGGLVCIVVLVLIRSRQPARQSIS